MKLPRLILVVIIIVSACGKNQTDSKNGIDEFDFLNQILRDTSIVNAPNGTFVISDNDYLPPPMFGEGKEIDFVSQKLSESDTTFLRNQFRSQKDFTTDSLTGYGFVICKVSALRATMKTDSLWSYITDKYNGGYYSVSKPIFNRSYDKAYIKIGYRCGPMCGSGYSYILKRENNKWVIEEFLGFWES